MIKTFFRLCLSVLLVTILLISVAGCIKIVQPEGNQATGDQGSTDTTSQQEPSGTTADSGAPPPTKPPGSQTGATTASGQATQSSQTTQQSGQSTQQGQSTSSSQPTPPAQSQSGAVANWTGTWQCATWGKLYLSQTGNQVTGWYDWDNGKITAYATGSTLVGTWSEAPTFNPPDDSGDLQFNLSADGNSFTGQWRYGASGDWDGSWGCNRINSAQPPSQPSSSSQQAAPSQPQPTPLANWTGTWRCGNYKMYLSQTGNQVTGWHEFQNWEFEGYATGSTLVGTWSDSQGGSGDFQLSMLSDGNSLSGNYRFGSSGNWQGSWSCTRTSSATPPSKPAAPNQSQPAPVATWSGSWLCGSYGRMNLSQSGNQVTGTYTYQGGQFTGYATGNTLVGTWSEQPTYNPPDDAGDVQFTMSADGYTFTGFWRYGSSGDWDGSWNGERDQ